MSRLTSLASAAAVGLLLLQLASWHATRAQSCNVRVEIESPSESTTVEPRQVVTGWAVDLGATSGTGIDAVVASLDGALDSPDNRLVGVAEYGAPRPEIADTLGEARFTNSGFTLAWDTATAPGGSHALFLQAHSVCGWHTASRVVTIPGPAAPAAAVSAQAGASSTVAPITPNTSSIIVAGGTATPITLVPTPVTLTAIATPTTGSAPGATAASSPAGALVVTPGALPPPPTSTTLQPPSNLRLAGTTSTGVTLTWDPPPGPSPNAYLIYQSAVTASGGNAPPVVVARVPGANSTVTLSGLQDPTRYTYYFTVATGAADGSASPYLLTTVSTTPANTRVPVPPTPPGGAPAAAAAVPGVNLTPSITPVGSSAAASSGAGGAFTPSVSASGSNGVTVSWPAQAGATAYNVYGASMLAGAPGQTPLAGAPPNSLTSAAAGTWVSVGSNVTGTSTTVNGLTPGGSYEFIVRTVNATGGEFSQSMPQPFSLPATSGAAAAGAPAPGSTAAAGTSVPPIASTLPPATSPATFVLTVTPASSTSLALSWNAFTGATSYGVLVSRPPGGQFVADSSRSALTTTSTTIDGLTAGSQFTFQIAAKDATGRELARSNQAPVTVGQPTAPGPLGMGAFPQAPGAATPGLVPTPGLSGAVPGVAPGTSASGTVPGVSPGTGIPGTVPGMAPGSGIPGMAPGATAAAGVAASGSLQLTSNVSDPGSANLQWTPIPGAASYSVWAISPTGQMQMVLPSTQNAAAYIPNLSPGQMTFQVRARDANGTDIVQSNPVTATISQR